MTFVAIGALRVNFFLSLQENILLDIRCVSLTKIFWWILEESL